MAIQTVLCLYGSGRSTDIVTDSGKRCFIGFLTERVYSFTATAERELVRDVMEKLCYTGSDYDTEHKSPAPIDKEKTHVLPDENIITVGAKRFRCAKVLFQSGFSDVVIRKELYANDVSSGGTAMFQVTGERITMDLTALTPTTMKVKVVAPPE